MNFNELGELSKLMGILNICCFVIFLASDLVFYLNEEFRVSNLLEIVVINLFFMIVWFCIAIGLEEVK